MPAADELTMLRRLLADWQAEKDARGPLAAAWLGGDRDAMDLLLNAPARKGAAKAHKRLVDDRNERFAELAMRLLERPGNAFVVVGARHLVGEDSLPRLLANKGLTVSKISTAEPDAAAAPKESSPR
jgi:hypothetical protein